MNIYIIIGTLLVSLAAEFNPELLHRLKFNPYDIRHRGQWYRFLTGGFVHGGIPHLAFNLFALWMFGDFAETFFQNLLRDSRAGSWVYLGFYLSAIPMSSLYSFEKHKNDEWYSAVGASGAISAVMFCFIIQQPFRGMGLLFIPVYIPAILFGALYLFASWYMARRGGDNIGHDAHFFGALYGALVTAICAPQLVTKLFSQLVP